MLEEHGIQAAVNSRGVRRLLAAELRRSISTAADAGTAGSGQARLREWFWCWSDCRPPFLLPWLTER